MKKLFLVLFTCSFFMPLWAQKATVADLQGKWKLITYTTINCSLDVATGKATVTETAKTLGKGLTDQLKKDIEAYADNLKIAYVEIEGNNYMQVIYDKVKAGPFTISEQENNQVINAQFDDGTTGSMYFKINGDKLILYFPQSSKTYTYQKEK